MLEIADANIEPGISLDRYMGQIVVLAKDHAAASASGVRFMTMSMSKGLTVEASIVIAAERGVVPDPRGQEDEERRLLYVAHDAGASLQLRDDGRAADRTHRAVGRRTGAGAPQ